MKIFSDLDEILCEYLVKMLGWEKYRYLIENVAGCIANDVTFQRCFNGYFLVRRNEEWRMNFYNVFEELKNQSPTFEQILHRISLGNNVEASFASKMLAIIDTNSPIIDRYVLEYFNKKIEGVSKEQRMKCAIRVYDEIKREFENLLKLPETDVALKKFDEQFPDYQQISKVKKIDFFIWLDGAIKQ